MERLDGLITELHRVISKHAMGNGISNEELDSLFVMKIGEEFGEVVQAWIAFRGQNPRKGMGPLVDVRKELGDVVVTALMAAYRLGASPRQLLTDAIQKLEDRR